MKNKAGKISLIITSLLFIATIQQTYPQISNVKFSTDIINFGKIASIQYPPKTIEFTNTSGEKLAILVVDNSADVKVGFEHKFINPGEKGTISLFYVAGNTGPFSEEIKVYTNLDNAPYILTINGICVSVEECFPDKANMNMRNIDVVNKITQQPVPNAQVSFIHNFKENAPIVCKTDKSGHAVKELPIGQYNAKSEVTGYEPYNRDFFLPRSQPNVVIELVPIKVILETTEPVTDANPLTKPGTSTSQSPVITSNELPEDKYSANNIVLLLDVSSSMKNSGKFALLQQSVNNLAMILRPIDNVSIITYAGDAKVILTSVPGNNKDQIMSAVQELIPYGITQGVKGLNTAYDLAEQKFIIGGNNQVILATDGEFSEKNVTDEYYQQFISGFATKGIKLSILGFGINEEAIARMKKMTDSGQGRYIQISSEKFVKDVLIDEIKTMSFMK